MTILRKTVSLLAVFSIIPAAWAVTMRPSAISATSGAMTATAANGVSRRLAVATAHKLLGNNYAPGNHAPQTDAKMGDVECVEEYSRCLAEDDACGSDFEECTSDVLFHAQMPDCVSTLMQCSTSGIETLFGADATFNNLNTAVKEGGIDEDGRIIDFIYPTDDSVIGQKIIAAEIDNRYSTEQCIRNYTRCLERDDVCGANFELCTSTKDFKNQALLCDSKLARCEAKAVYELFGSKTRYKTASDADLKSSDAVLSKRISDGASYVAINAVDSCYALVDNCFTKACASNPFRCMVGTSVNQLLAADNINKNEDTTNAPDGKDGTNKTPANTGDGANTGNDAKTDSLTTNNEVNRFLRTSCADTIGLNKACHMTVFGKNVKEKDLADSEERYDIIDEVYSTLYDTRISYIQSNVATIAQNFDSHAKQECIDVIQKCAIRSCGGGSGAACYTKVMQGDERSLASGDAYNDIKDGCSAIVNTNPYCLYASATLGEQDVYSYSFSDNGAFSRLFPQSGTTDPIGAVASTNALLFSTYNEAGLARMKNECENTLRDCVRSVCGADYSDCYLRNQQATSITDVIVDGSLDYTIVLGKCLGAIKQDKNCDEHRAIEVLALKDEDEAGGYEDDYVPVWGEATSVHDAFVGVGKTQKDYIRKKDKDGEFLCRGLDDAEYTCGSSDSNGHYVDDSDPIYVTYNEQATDNLFYEMMQELNAEAQGEYRRQRLKVQKMCLDMNSVGGNSAQRIYRWIDNNVKSHGVSIKTGEDATEGGSFYSTGISAKSLDSAKDSPDLYNGYCAVRVTLRSDDPLIMSALSGELKTITEDNTPDYKDNNKGGYKYSYNDSGKLYIEDARYFAIGDAFACGSWLTQEQLEKIAKVAEMTARRDTNAGQATEWRAIAPVLGALGLGTGGVFLGDAIQKGDIFSGLSGKTSAKKGKDKAKNDEENCAKLIEEAADSVSSTEKSTGYKSKVRAVGRLLKEYGKESSFNLDTYNAKSTEYEEAIDALLEVEEDENAAETAKTNAKDTAKSAAKALKTAIRDLDGACSNIAFTEATETGWWNENGNGGKLLGGVIGAGAGAALGYVIADGVLDSELDAAGQAAYKEFMDTVGSKIHCYIGSQKVASFGQLIETSME